MIFIRKISWILILVFFFIFTSQALAFFGQFTIQDEAELGKKFKILLRSHYPVIEDPVIVGYLNRIVKRLNSVIPPNPFPFKVAILRDNSLNAFAAPAGYIFIHSGLILKMDSSSELAAILAHEMAHVTQRHIAGNIERSKIISIGSLVGVLAGALIGQSSAVGEALAVGSMAGGQAAALKFSREDEREADRYGLQYLNMSDFDPKGMLESFQMLRRQGLLGGRGTPPPYMMTHPGLSERIGYVKDLIARLPKSESNVLIEDEPLDRAKMMLRSRYSSIDSAKVYFDEKKNFNCLDLLGKGIILERMNRMCQARKALEKALACNGGDALFYREVGRFYFQQGDFNKALTYLNKALDNNPKDYFAQYFLSRTLAEKGQIKESVEQMRKVVKALPEDSDVHYSYGRILGQNGEPFLGYLHYAYASLYSGNKEKTKYYMSRAGERADTPSERERFKKFKEKYETIKKYW